LAGLLNFCGPDKLFFHFFQSFFERLLGLFVRPNPPLMEGAKGWQAFFFTFFWIFKARKTADYADVADRADYG
jgi:hypothetical protein